jgi:hypothetical protein
VKKINLKFKILFFLIFFLGLFGLAKNTFATTFLQEGFETSNMSSRGWFDGSTMAIDTSNCHGGNGCAKWTWATGQSKATGVSTYRYLMTPSDDIVVDFWWKFNTDWVGSGEAYHPHLILIPSDVDVNADGAYMGLAQCYLDTYIETGNGTNGLTPRAGIQDALNINYSYGTLPNNLISVTENRDVAGCNGNMPGSDLGDIHDCYSNGDGTYSNGRLFSGSSNFVKGQWQHVVVHFRMNSVVGGIGQHDGILNMSLDGTTIINKTNVLYRTGAHPTMKWEEFVIAPYMTGSNGGSPQTQTMWMDDLAVSNSAGSGDTTPPSAPSGLAVN